ncbi:hypothetical protein [Magnetofaba australis]|uniref:Uncharacterized protein n=1 Tax=Magnetofaba australis IT-1 TaxID=1434232 RepID=A0A1Y2K4M5_9PROT|nr:hypothetical protein [Magnetofaba australis]OSM04189.1 hypothetical protein MAIT1_04044 [Magnetofaba australis IT-1]
MFMHRTRSIVPLAALVALTLVGLIGLIFLVRSGVGNDTLNVLVALVVSGGALAAGDVWLNRRKSAKEPSTY